MRTLLTAFSLVLTTAACGGQDQATRAINLRFNISGYGGKPFEIQLACDPPRPPRASETGPGARKEGVVWSTSNACRAIEAKRWLVGLDAIPPGEGRRTHCSGPDTGRNIAIEGTYRGERVKLRVNDCRDRRGLPLLDLLGRVVHLSTASGSLAS